MFHSLLDLFFLTDSQSALVMYGGYDWGMVALSVLIAVITSIMAMQLAGMAREEYGRLSRQVAILSGALVLGAGVWSMHFIGMLAFDLCSSARYDPVITLLSMLPSFLASWVALGLLAREQARLAEREAAAGEARRAAVEARARLIAENIELLVGDCECHGAAAPHHAIDRQVTDFERRAGHRRRRERDRRGAGQRGDIEHELRVDDLARGARGRHRGVRRRARIAASG